MALLFMDSFDTQGTGADIIASGRWGSFATNNGSTNSTAARTGTCSLKILSTAATTITRAFATSGGAIVGVAFYGGGSGFAGTDIIRILEGSTIHATVAITASGILTVTRASTVLATGTRVILPSSWYYIELKAVIHDTLGSYELRIDGATELTATNVDTRNGGTGVWDRIALCGANSNSYYDDFYLCDTSGSIRNNFLGPIKIECLLPQTDAVAVGSNTGLTPSTGTDHGALVDEVPPNTTDYNGSATAGVKDTYNYPPTTLTGNVVAVQTNLYASKSDATARQVCAVVRTGGVDFDGANISPTTSFTYLSTIFSQNPQTAVDWTLADIATIQVGMKVTV